MRVCKSRFTPGLANAEKVGLQKGDKVTYQLLTGEKRAAVITSDFCEHSSGAFGYEGDIDGMTERSFLDEKRIVDWVGKEP